MYKWYTIFIFEIVTCDYGIYKGCTILESAIIGYFIKVNFRLEWN